MRKESYEFWLYLSMLFVEAWYNSGIGYYNLDNWTFLDILKFNKSLFHAIQGYDINGIFIEKNRVKTTLNFLHLKTFRTCWDKSDLMNKKSRNPKTLFMPNVFSIRQLYFYYQCLQFYGSLIWYSVAGILLCFVL